METQMLLILLTFIMVSIFFLVFLTAVGAVIWLIIAFKNSETFKTLTTN